MFKTIIIFLSALFCFWTIQGQTKLPTRDSVYVFWQTEYQLEAGDYKNTGGYKGVYAEIALWTVLDLPGKTEVLTPKQMKFYIAPVCNRYRSYADKKDKVLFATNAIYFDILELSARSARVKLANLQDSAVSAEALSNVFKKIVLEMHEDRLRMTRKFHKEMLRDDKEGTLTTWQEKLKQELNNTAQWATRPIDCYRFLQNHPLEKDYIEELNSNAVLLSDNYEMVLGRAAWHAEFCQISRLKLIQQ